MFKKTLVIIIGFLISITLTKGVSAMEDQIVVLETNQGNIEIKLMPELAPKA